MKKTHEYKNSDQNNAHLLYFEEKKISLGKKTKIFLTQKLIKVTISQKLWIAQKWAPGQFQSTLQILPLLKKVEFLGRQLSTFGRQWHPNAIWCDMKFYAHHSFSTLRIFYVRMAIFEGERVLDILSWETTYICSYLF